MICPDCGRLRHEGICPDDLMMPTDAINDLADAKPTRVVMWRRIESAPKDRPILLGWFGSLTGVFCMMRGEWGEGLGTVGWMERNENGYVARATYPNLPKWWAEDILGEPPRDT